MNDLKYAAIDSTVDAKIGRKLVSSSYNEVFVNKQFVAAGKYLDLDSTPSDSSHLRFKGKLINALTNPEQHFDLQVHRTIGEGNMVLVQSSYQYEKEKWVLYDFCQVTGDQITGLWSIEQAIPDKMMHNNGII